MTFGKDRVENTAFQTVHWRAGRCLATAVVSFVSRLLPSNGSIRYNTLNKYKRRLLGVLRSNTK
jgi:hypothetical protein